MLKYKKPIIESKFNSVVRASLTENNLTMLDKHWKKIPDSYPFAKTDLLHSPNTYSAIYYNGFVYTREVQKEHSKLTTVYKRTYWRYKVIPVQAFCIDTLYRDDPRKLPTNREYQQEIKGVNKGESK